ncbi:MAG: endonuclease domain-containing protein [Parvibaculum sp.]|uniref:endonuclease domain-containing protein n=1 Tax=Parvibaculum sp. TaxID=2024848 RepID=UPI0025E0EE70|nr:endonuclease domain-containing protein [Parvibaculum sp.]MCE9648798.1 endonuclease domain-containing protein [Parvibaculum sp.]
MARKLIRHARSLRVDQTDAEARIWSRLRNRSLGNARFRRQIAIDPYIVDFICTEHMLIVELDGGQHADQIEYDESRTKFLESRGYRVLRFWNNDALANTDGVIEAILAELVKRPSPRPSP